MRKPGILAVVAFFVLLSGSLVLRAQEPAVTVLRCGHVIDVRSGQVLTNQEIVIIGDSIASVAPTGTTELPPAAQIIDLGQATVLPGLIDVHTHLVGGAGTYDSTEPLKKSGAQMALEAVAQARATLEAGFTSVRDLGPPRAFVDVALRDAIDQGIVPGPRMQPAGAYVTISGGAGDVTGLAADIVLPLALRYGVADGPDEVRQRVREIIRHGAGVIKVLATGAVLTLSSQPGAQEFSYEEMRAAVEEANKAGLKVAAHAHGAAGAKAAIRAGVASIEHGSFLDEEALQMMKERGTYLVVDLYDHQVIMEGMKHGFPPEFVEKERLAGENQVKVLKRALELGVPVAFGTDAGVFRHGENARQFGVYVHCGMPPLTAIRSSTLWAAHLMGWDDRVGTLEAGKLADIIAVRENPLDNIRTLEDIPFVMKGGRVFKDELH